MVEKVEKVYSFMGGFTYNFRAHEAVWLPAGRDTIEKMNCAENYKDLLLYLEQVQSEINNTFTKDAEVSVQKKPPKTMPFQNGLSKIEEENIKNNSNPNSNHGSITPTSDPEDIELNLKILVKLNEAIKSDLSELLANYDLNQKTQNLCNGTASFNEYRHINEYQDDAFSHFENLSYEDKRSTDIETLSDLGSISLSTISNPHVATQTSPSPSESSTNLTWASSSPGSDTESSESDYLSYSKRVFTNGKSSSAPILEKVSPSLQVSRQSRSQSDRHLAEIEAAEACKWLRATGFPQYAQMYEDMQFPIDLSQAEQDHTFLEPDDLNSLFRRLQILNSCANLHQQRVTHTDESDDEYCALSDKWTFQSDTRRWSRTCSKGPYPNLEEINKRIESGSFSSQEKDDVFEKCTQSPKERLRRAGSSKFRRRRQGVFLSEREPTLENISPINSLKILEINHISDSEITPRHQRKVRTKSFDKTDTWLHSPHEVDRVIWQNLPETGATQLEESEDDHKPTGEEIPLNQLSATQLQMLRKLALLKLTAHMEKHCPSHRSGWNWDLPKFIRKMKAPVYKDKNVFGVPLTITLQRTGQVLPRNIEEALRWLQQNATDQVGIFRKPGVKSRIQALRNLVESNVCVDYSDQQSYDVADMVKQYFRELPETLLTNKLSETFILIFQYVPVYLRRESVLCALLLMPDEHIEVLQALLHFLLLIAKHSEINQMNESNLAMCFAPSLFHYSQTYKQNVGSPHPKELAENKAGYDCLYYFLKNFNRLFKVPQEFIKQCKSSELKDCKAKLLSDLGSKNGGWKEYLKECESNLLKEAKEKQRGWISVSSFHPRVEIAYKKVADGIPLRLWKVTAEIEAPPSEVLHRLLREKHVWDPELRSAKIVAQLEQKSEIFQYVRASITPRPAEEYCIVRTWRTNLPKDGCLLIETSVEHPEALPVPHSTRGLILASRYLIEPCGSGKSRLLHLSRVDTMGRSPEWYQKHFGHLQASFVANVQSSFSSHQNTLGPESKV
ncbi:rho GTPase-activating protein 7 isoform X2 [Sitophilus oryzae]|uniref:Rho GTPase-activating protein 7 isoform X2 n=2 Tax=Sitophilus oryzae TaxID=7048 RepID=A0A6J2Y0P0_SITOR|nr:rho GTPase-activating protein 7 isoform X2 [Sitophilus oryzae]